MGGRRRKPPGMERARNGKLVYAGRAMLKQMVADGMTEDEARTKTGADLSIS